MRNSGSQIRFPFHDSTNHVKSRADLFRTPEINQTATLRSSINSLDRKTISRIFDLVIYKVYAELKAEAQRSYLGLIWWLVEPVLFMFIFYFVFDVLFTRSIPDFLAFLLIGLTMWHWMQSTVIQCGNSISGNRSIIQQVLVPKAVFPTVIVLANFVKFLFVFSILIVFLLVYGIEPQWGWFYSLPVMAVAILLMSGFGFLMASIVPLIPDVRVLIDNGFRAVFFLSGIFYEIEALPEKIVHALAFNPFAVLISAFRKSLMTGTQPDIFPMLWITILSIAMLIVSLVIMRKKRSRYAKALI